MSYVLTMNETEEPELKEAKHRDLEAKIIAMLLKASRSTRSIARELGVDVDTAYLVLRRLKSYGRCYNLHGRWHECKPPAKTDTSVFPRPWWPTPEVGFFW